MTQTAMYNGCTSKPTPRSETDRLKSKVRKGFGNEEAFLNAWIVTLFTMTAVNDNKALKTQFAM